MENSKLKRMLAGPLRPRMLLLALGALSIASCAQKPLTANAGAQKPGSTQGPVMASPAVSSGSEAAPPPLSAEEMTRYEGEYLLQAGSQTRELRVFQEEGQLKANLAGQGTSRLLPQGSHAFLAEVEPSFRFVFHVAKGRAESLSLYVNGKEVPGKRKQ